MSALEILIDMGFSKQKAEKALLHTDNKGVEPAMEWLLAHGDSLDDEELAALPEDTQVGDFPKTEIEQEEQSEAAESDTKVEVAENEPTEADTKSIKCDDCGRLFRSYDEVELHAVKSGHQSFSQSSEEVKALSEEEKREQVKKIENLIKARRAEKEEQEKREELEREKVRRKQGQELTHARQRLQEEEIKLLAEQKRKEKLEAKMARQRVLEEIERDKQARKEKFGGGATTAAAATPTPQPPPAPVAQTQPTSDEQNYEECRLQIRLTNGECLTQTFNPKEELAAVRLFIEMNRTDGSGPFSLMTNFPKRVFSQSDMESPLYSLGLVPSAVLIVTKQH